MFERASLNLRMKEFHRHSLKYSISETGSNRDFEAKCRREIILHRSTIVLVCRFYQKWLKMTRYTTPVYFVSFMHEDNQFRSFFTAANYLFFDGFLSAFSCKPLTFSEWINDFVYFVEGCRHESTKVHQCVIDDPPRDFLVT